MIQHLAQSVSLVISTTTGLISPQFHITHDDFFETCRAVQRNQAPVKRQILSGLTHNTISPNFTFTVNPFTKISEGVSNTTEGSEGDTSTITNISSHTSSSPPADTNTNSNNNVDDPPVLPPPVHLPPEKPSQNPSPDLNLPCTRSGWIRTRPYFLVYSSYYDAHHQDDYLIQDQISDSTSFSSTSAKDTMYYHEAIR